MARPKKVQEAVEEQGAEAEAPASQPEKVKPVHVSTKQLTGDGKRYASDVQQRVFERQAAKSKAKEDRAEAIWKQAKEVAKTPTFIQFKDRNGEFVPALVLGVEDTQKKDKGGPVLDENNEPVMEAKLKLYVFSNIDEPRKVLYSFEDGGK